MDSSQPLYPVLLVTGGYGLLGTRVVPLLAQSIPDAQIIVVGRNEGRDRWELSQVRYIHGDLSDSDVWSQLPATITHVFHLAAAIPWKTDERFRASVVTDNLQPLANLIEHSQHWRDFQQIIYCSSVSVYTQTDQFLNEDSPRQPATLYGAAKLAGEELLHCIHARGVRTVSLRLSSLYALGQYEGTVMPIMVKRAMERQDIVIFGDGKRTQDFVHCEDAARALLLCFQKEAQGVYNVGTGIPVTMTELAETISRVFADGKAKISYQPAGAGSDYGIKLDISKAGSELSYQPMFQLESGLQKLKKEMEDTQE